MKLEEFVKQTLVEITNGVTEAIKESSKAIAPFIINGKAVSPAPQLVRFDVAVTTKKEGGAGVINVLPIELKGKIFSEHVNRISFQVPVYFELNWTEERKPKK